MEHKQAERVFVCGRSGSGKSTIVKAMIAELKAVKLIVFDVQDEYSKGRPGWVRVTNMKDLIRTMKAKWKKGFKIAYVPTGELMATMDRIAKLVWDLQVGYEKGVDMRQLTLVVEEANTGIPNRTMPADMFGVERLSTRGRHRGINVIAVSQRPALVHTTFRGNCGSQFVFALANDIDRKNILQTVGPQHGVELREMPNFKFWKLKDGQIQRGHTTSSGRYKLS
ncbi:helicase HerA domain-containing protein [Pseudovibrio ascidiaceicola]|uniref:helicase HerA domain-containing protein n=1 Tax=Pseudovibrio ascidiaceicola TaxID=285279 RepID=UPI003D35A700